MTLRAFKNSFPEVGPGAYVDATAVVIGDVILGADASLWPMVVARGDVHRIVIGARTNIQDGAILHVTQPNPFTPAGYALHIGEDVTVGHGAILHGCTIENKVLIGMGATVLDGATIRTHVLLAAGSVVPPGKDLEGGYLWLGSPAKKARPLSAQELAYLDYSAAHYVALKNAHQCAS